jgi:hypothetical protein
MRKSHYLINKLDHTLAYCMLVFSSSLLVNNNIAHAQQTPPTPLNYIDSGFLHEIIKEVSANRIERHIRTLTCSFKLRLYLAKNGAQMQPKLSASSLFKKALRL